MGILIFSWVYPSRHKCVCLCAHTPAPPGSIWSNEIERLLLHLEPSVLQTSTLQETLTLTVLPLQEYKYNVLMCLFQNPSSVYTGFIKVLIDLRRPVTVRGGQKGGVSQEAFYLTRGVDKTLHISSENTVKQVEN